MKCFVEGCPSEIDELKEFPVKYGPKGVTDEHETAQRAHAAELERWTFMLIVKRGAGDEAVAHGHVCPDHEGAVLGLSAKGSA